MGKNHDDVDDDGDDDDDDDVDDVHDDVDDDDDDDDDGDADDSDEQVKLQILMTMAKRPKLFNGHRDRCLSACSFESHAGVSNDSAESKLESILHNNTVCQGIYIPESY